MLLLLHCFNANAQTNSSFQHLSIENGLSDNMVHCITQDAQGFIWIGTPDGLNKFNGYSTKIFRQSDSDSSSIPFHYISCSFRDKSNRLWFGGNGLMVCDPVKEKFKHYYYKKNEPNSLGNNDVTAVAQDEHGQIWVGTRQGLFALNESKENFTKYLHDTTGSIHDVYSYNRIIEIVPDNKGNLWIATLNGFYKFSISNHEFTPFLQDKIKSNSLLGNTISSLAFDKEGKLWLAVDDSGLCVFDIQKNQLVKFSSANSYNNFPARSISKIFCDSKGKIWITTYYDGVVVFNPSTNEWFKYLNDQFDSESLADNKTLSAFEDQSGMVWIGTESRGVDRISPIPSKFKRYITQPGKVNSLSEKDITAVCEDSQNNLWIGSKNGLIFFNRKNNSFEIMKHDEKNENSLSHNHIYALAKDAIDNLWIATEKGLNYFNTKTNNWTHYYHQQSDSNSIPSNEVYEVFIKSNGTIWAGTSGGICRLNIDKNTIDHRYNNTEIQKLIPEYYTSIYESSNHNIWLSTSRAGIYLVDDSFKIILTDLGLNNFNARKAFQFTNDANGNTWIASSNGLFYFDVQTNKINRVLTDSIIDVAELLSIAISENHNIWFATANGLFLAVLDNNNQVESITGFNSSDGLQSNSFNPQAALKLSSGELFFGGLNGFNLFKPENISYNSFIPPVQLTRFKIFDKDFRFANSKSATEIKLNYYQNFFSFEMGAMSFDHPEKNQYAYQLEGFDEKMIYNGTNHFASYTNVPPGKYTLHIIASNNDGVWNKTGTRISIVIIPPFWKTNWFRIISIIALLSLISLIYFLRIRKIKLDAEKASEINKKIAEARLTALRAQMNPHFIFNSLNSIQQFISASEKEEALKYLSRFSKLIRLVLQNADKNEIKLSDELNMLEFYLQLEALRFSNKFSFHFTIDTNVNPDAIEIPTMLLQPYIENAVVHGLLNQELNGHLELTLNRNNNKLICTIEDNGIGREAAAIIKNKKFVRHESLGMKVTEERMQMLEQVINKKAIITVHDLKDENQNATGTKVIIEIEIDD